MILEIKCPICSEHLIVGHDSITLYTDEETLKLIRRHWRKHSIGDLVDFLEEGMISQLVELEKQLNKPNLTCDKAKEPPCHLEPCNQLCAKCPLDKPNPIGIVKADNYEYVIGGKSLKGADTPIKSKESSEP